MKGIKMKTLTITIIALVVVFIAGCLAENWWPCNRDPFAVKYGGGDPNKISFINSNMANARIDGTNIEKTHLQCQLEYKMKLDLDNGQYNLTSAINKANIADAQKSFNTIIGTLEQPGWGLATVLGLLGITGTALYKNATMYSEQEHQTALNAAQANNVTAPPAA
jgi:hypothetical protein